MRLDVSRLAMNPEMSQRMYGWWLQPCSRRGTSIEGRMSSLYAVMGVRRMVGQVLCRNGTGD
jgi:hypothetical protein